MTSFQIPSDEDIITNINIPPLVDILLGLLILFVVVATIVDFSSIEPTTPTSKIGTAIQQESIAIVISQTGAYFLDGHPMANREQLTEALILKKITEPNAQVFISGDRQTQHDKIADISDLVRNVGLKCYQPTTMVAANR